LTIPSSQSQDETISNSLLFRVQQQDEVAWKRMTMLFLPVVHRWVRTANIPEHDAGDVVQEVFLSVLQSIGKFHRNEAGDTFRGWLRRITQFKSIDYHRRKVNQPNAVGGSDAFQRVHDLPDIPIDDDAQQDFDEITSRALELVREEFEPRTWAAFHAIVIQQRPASDVAVENAMSLGAVYVAKSRVLKRLRSELDGLVEETERKLLQ
jgi:RNA polymerase sigma-70 factor (ECF subfamily)